MSVTIRQQVAPLRYRLVIILFGILMAIGSFLTDYLVAAGFFVLVAIGGALLTYQKIR